LKLALGGKYVDFRRQSLASNGFTGFVSFRDLKNGQLKNVPTSGGVYIVLRELETVPTFLDENPGGHFKGRNPTLQKTLLAVNWVEHSHTIYIGKGDKLQRRMKQFIDFGFGKPVGHWGGRLVWQVENSVDFIVGWKQVNDPASVESQLLIRFSSIYGKLPYANLRL
jgi:hypothetical protein